MSRTLMRTCGKRYASADEAANHKTVRAGTHVVVPDCQWCGAAAHIRRKPQAGDTAPARTLPLKPSGRRPSEPADATRSGADPALVPVMLFSEHGSHITVWLSDDGAYLFETPKVVTA